jgi:hypothetical protein
MHFELPVVVVLRQQLEERSHVGDLLVDFLYGVLDDHLLSQAVFFLGKGRGVGDVMAAQ